LRTERCLATGEGDLILGKNGRSAIGAMVECSSRFVILLQLPKDHGPAAVEEAMIAATQRLPQTLWKTLTWDRGAEMRNHARISVATDLTSAGDSWGRDPSLDVMASGAEHRGELSGRQA